MPRISWDPKVTLGNVLTIIIMLGTLLGGYLNLKIDAANASGQITAVQKQVEPVDNLIVRMAVVERNQVSGKEQREEFQARTETVLEELRRQNIEVLKAIARLEAKL